MINNKPIFNTIKDECIACKKNNINLIYKKSKMNMEFDIWKCYSCGTCFMNPRPNVHFLKKIYSISGHNLKKPIDLVKILDDEQEYPNSSIDAKRLIDKAINIMGNRKIRVLDIGSGYGFYTREAIKRGYYTVSINPGKWENIVFEKMNGIKPIEAYIENVNLNEKFDLIILSQVLEHIDDIDLVMQKINEVLAKDGVLAIAVPNIDSILVKLFGTSDNTCLWIPEHLNYFSKKGLIEFLDRNGFVTNYYLPVSRIPYYIISDKLSLKGTARRFCNLSFRFLQTLPLRLCDKFGYSLYHNVWCTRKP